MQLYEFSVLESQAESWTSEQFYEQGLAYAMETVGSPENKYSLSNKPSTKL